MSLKHTINDFYNNRISCKQKRFCGGKEGFFVSIRVGPKFFDGVVGDIEKVAKLCYSGCVELSSQGDSGLHHSHQHNLPN